MSDESVEIPEASLTDKLMSAKAQIEVPPKSGHFDERENPNPFGEELPVKEKDLPVVKEALSLFDQSRETNRLVSRTENPLGDNLDSVLIYTMGDIHITGNYPEEAVESRSPALRIPVEIGWRSILGRIKGKDWYHKERPAISVEKFREISEAVIADIGRRERSKFNL